MWYALITLSLVVFIVIAYLSCLWEQGLCLSCSQPPFQGLALHTGTLNLCSDSVEVAGTGYGFNQFTGSGNKISAPSTPPTISHVESKTKSQKPQENTISAEATVLFLQHKGAPVDYPITRRPGGREGPPTPHRFAHQNSVQRQAFEIPREQRSFVNLPNIASIWLAESRGIVETRTAKLTRPLVLYPRMNSLFPFLHFPPTCRRVGNRKAHNPPLPLHQASILRLSRLKL